jgi:hypothetical protein
MAFLLIAGRLDPHRRSFGLRAFRSQRSGTSIATTPRFTDAVPGDPIIDHSPGAGKSRPASTPVAGDGGPPGS